MTTVDDTKKQNILIVHNYYQIPGGEDTVVQNEKGLLESKGHNVILYKRSNSEINQMGLFRKMLLPLSTVFNIKTYFDIKRIIRHENIDVVHVHNTLNMISPAVYYAATNLKIPVVQTIHNFRLLCPGATFYRDGAICEECLSKSMMCSIKHKCYRGSRLQTMICVISNLIHRKSGIYKKINYICLTEFNKKKIQMHPSINAERIYVKPNFCNSVISRIISYEERKDYFIFAGRLDELKGVDTLLEAWKILGVNAPELIICGIGPKREECERYIIDNSLENIKMVGFVENSKVRDMVMFAQALILPTKWYEGFPMSIVEAFSLGTPVITSDIGNAGSLIQDGINGKKFEVGNAIKLAEIVKSFPNMVNQTFEIYNEKYTENENYKLLMQIYEESK